MKLCSFTLFLSFFASPEMFALLPVIDILRGDANNNGHVNVSDVSYIDDYLFNAGAIPSCLDAADVNDDGTVNVSDAVYLSTFLFQGGSAPPNCYPYCAEDPSSDSLGCVSSYCP